MIAETIHHRFQIVADMLMAICGVQHVFTNTTEWPDYGMDQTLLQFPFDILVKPGSAEEISAIVKVCNQYKIPLTPRGGGTGVTGGALPVQGGIVLSLERLNKIITINTSDAYVVAEAGVITNDLCRAVEAEGLYFPVQPTSGAWSFIGGNVAENAGSIHSCKYGSTGRYVLNLEVVLPNGEIIWTGANVSKNASGFNLTQLFVGSEGMLGIITKVVYRLLPAPAEEILLLSAFHHLHDACRAVTAIKQLAVLPSSVELICYNALQLTAGYLQRPLPLVKDHIEAHLLVGLQEREADHALETVNTMLQQFTSEDILIASTSAQKETVRTVRLNIGHAMNANGNRYRDVDVCIPSSCLYQYIRQVEQIASDHHISLVCFGHAFDGNLHTMLKVEENNEADLNRAVTTIYRFAISLGGVISGEHGIGLLQKEFMPFQFSASHLALMRNLKGQFDPNNILNPGKVI